MTHYSITQRDFTITIHDGETKKKYKLHFHVTAELIKDNCTLESED